MQLECAEGFGYFIGMWRFRLYFCLVLLAAAGLPSAQGQTTRLVEGFTPSSHSAWKPFLKSPAVRSAADGIRFPLPFAKPLLPFREEVDRVAWDKKVAFNLEPPVAF